MKNKVSKKSALLERPAEIAAYFGFEIISSPLIGKEDIRAIRTQTKAGNEIVREEDIYEAEEKARLLRLYMNDLQLYPQHSFFFYKKPLSGGSIKQRRTQYECGLDIIGSPRGIAEAILMRAALSILEEEGLSDLEISLNSMGDKESISLLERELGSYYRKNIESLPAACRHLFKKDPFEILRSEIQECREATQDAPRPMNLLSEVARIHFKEVLEFAESSGISYTIDNHLVRNPLYASNTIFDIYGTTKGGKRVRCASGYRYTLLSKRIGMKKEIPAVGVSLSFKVEGIIPLKRMPKQKFYLIQLGPAAKLKSLEVIEMLRKMRVPVIHALTKDKYTGQSGTAENLKLPYVLIIGQKEAIENTVVVRDTKTRFQDTVPLTALSTYLKKLL